MAISEFLKQYSSKLSGIASLMILSGVIFIILFTVVFFLLRIWLKWKTKYFTDADGKKKISIAFFHPYCNAGGGGERVLWVAVRSIQKRYPAVQCVIFTGDTGASPEEILDRARQRFNIVLPQRVEFVYLHYRSWVEAVKYPYFTLLGQSIGSVFLGFEALFSFVPDIYIDTMGYAFTLPLFKFVGGCKVACYVHYPTISTDMLSRVFQRVEAHNNASFISKSLFLSNLKLIYYKLFAYLYGVAGKRSNVIMVNSTWTYNHILSLWNVPSKTHIVYPPCDISEFMSTPLVSDENKPKQILSLGQFRPEKDHPLQIQAFHKFLMGLDEAKRVNFKLVLAGSCRNEEDENRVKNLQRLSKELQIEKNVEFHLNVAFSELKQLLEQSLISIHTMWNEHFGICVVEGMAAGTVMLAHDSGGPKMDIVVTYEDKPTGFLAHDVDSYSCAIKEIFDMSPQQRLELRQNARNSLTRFSEAEFEVAFLTLCEPLLRSTGIVA
ncbi:GDP-Man:Man(3)GlcNAc(2)-PP-Dol alpha-1,2-mannosyltransferase-like [Physella acuta]|uniref:GDP-Man:Man(3)GlcNAc(2)-PP-Dol alpha-1,2-mannosyltransferase-like n=1 Tax=Physella acuta TaxID=109671 RepID=UPI0027DD388A|nr:GDP-Man:Man(3)GlcNAc(2)-PP-Dol alpha-1,2-mannosyltransferase-like [Physella acuta]